MHTNPSIVHYTQASMTVEQGMHIVPSEYVALGQAVQVNRLIEMLVLLEVVLEISYSQS